jgi:peptidoglycan hydrolase CwlO-like protein
MKHYEMMTAEELESEIHNIDFEISDLTLKIEDEEDYINKSHGLISRWKSEINGLQELREDLFEMSRNR